MSLCLKDGDIDTYIATFDNLVAKVSWMRGEETAHVFQNGLDRGVMGTILDRPTWPITLDKWQSTARDETNRYKARKAILGGRQPPRHIHIPQQYYQPPRNPNAMEVNIIETRHAYRPVPPETTTCAPKVLQHGQTCYVCRKKGHYAKDCPNKRATTTLSRSRPGDQSINAAQPRQWANSRLRTPPPTTEISRSTPGHQSTGNTTIRQCANGPLPRQMTTLPWSRPGYQSNGNYNSTRQSINGTTQNNVPLAPPMYRTNSQTPSPTLPQSTLGEQSNTMEQTGQMDTRIWNNSNGFVAKAPTEMTRITQHGTQNSENDPQTLDTMAQPMEFVNISWVAKEIWLEFNFVT